MVITLALSAWSGALGAQATTRPAADGRPVGPVAAVAAQAAIDRARTLVESGQSADARALLDSLVSASGAEPGDLADALYWRAVLGERAADAERDWKRLILEVPLSPRVPAALLRLGELEMVRGHPVTARTYLERLARDYPQASERPKALLWVVRSYFDERDVTRACAALTTLRQASVPAGEIRLQTNQLQQRCARASATATAGAAAGAAQPDAPTRATGSPAAPSNASPTTSSAPGPVTGTAAASASGRFSVQIAAYNTRAEAETAARRVVARGLDARVDGEVKPFRVRIGRYDTRAEAEAALVELKKKGQDGFVAVVTP